MIVGGANLVQRPPVFSADGKLLLVCTGRTVSVFSVASGLLVNSLEGHTAPVTSVCVVNSSGVAKSVIHHAWTSSLDGTVRFWDYKTGSLIKTVKIDSPIISMVIPTISSLESAPSSQILAFMLVQLEKNLSEENNDTSINGKANDKQIQTRMLHDTHESRFQVVLCDLRKKKLLVGHLAKLSARQLLVCSQRGGLVGVVDVRKIWIWNVPIKTITHCNSVLVTIVHHTKALQTMAFNPMETVVSGSDINGRILLWENIGDHTFIERRSKGQILTKGEPKDELDTNRGARGSDDAAALTTYHWHSEVKFLMFSADGVYLLSGGREAVFVMWHLETGNNQFLPRFGSILLHCASSSDASIFSVSCADNTIRLVNIGTMTVQKTIQGIKPYKELPGIARICDGTKAVIQPGTGRLVLPTEDMSVQFYDCFHERHITEIEICPRNYVSVPVKKTKERYSPVEAFVIYITHVTFSCDGSTMATAEFLTPEEEIGGGSCLKFWRAVLAKPHFALITQVNEPHGNVEISSLVYHPSMDMVVSCCTNGEFKVWVQEESSWRCRSVGAYQHKPMHCAAFSPDGTLLAVGTGEVITLWNPVSNGLLHVFTSAHRNSITSISFVPMTTHLVSASSGKCPELTVWNLQTLSLCWSYNMEVRDISVESKTGHFAALVPLQQNISSNKEGRQGSIAVFHVSSPSPRELWNVQDDNGCVVFIGTSDVKAHEMNNSECNGLSESDLLLYLNPSREYAIFNPFEADKSLLRATKRFTTMEQQGLSKFELVYGKAIESSVEVKSNVFTSQAVQPWQKLLDCPSHLISLSNIGIPYIESLLQRRVTQEKV